MDKKNKLEEHGHKLSTRRSHAPVKVLMHPAFARASPHRARVSAPDFCGANSEVDTLHKGWDLR